MTRASRRYPICRGPLDQSGLGSSHTTTWARAMLQLAIYEIENVLQYIVINKLFGNHQLFLVFFSFFSSLSTKHNWHHNRHNHGRRRRKRPPSTPHEAFHSMPMLRIDGWQPPELADVFFGGGLRVFMALKVLLWSGNDGPPQHRSVLRAINTLNSPKNYIRMLGGLSPIHLTCPRNAQGLMWGTRGRFLSVATMVGYGCVGWCWPLEAYIRSTYLGIVKIVYGSILFIPT